MADELKIELEGVTNKHYSHFEGGNAISEVYLNREPDYFRDNVIGDIGDEYDTLDDATRLPGSALFISPQKVIDEIGNTVFKDIMEQRAQEKGQEQKRKKFRLVRKLFNGVKSLFKKKEKEIEDG